MPCYITVRIFQEEFEDINAMRKAAQAMGYVAERPVVTARIAGQALSVRPFLGRLAPDQTRRPAALPRNGLLLHRHGFRKSHSAKLRGRRCPTVRDALMASLALWMPDFRTP